MFVQLLSPSSFNPLAALAAAAFMGLGCAGAALQAFAPYSKVTHTMASTNTQSAPRHIKTAEWKVASYPAPVSVSAHNLQSPRVPRQKGERSTSNTCDIEEIVEEIATSAATVLLEDHRSRAFLVTAFIACPLAGHPLSLLRPPSHVAG